jgi:hypothetical protein
VALCSVCPVSEQHGQTARHLFEAGGHLLPPVSQSLRPGGGFRTGLRLSAVRHHHQADSDWQSSVLRLSPFRPRLFGDGFRFHRRHQLAPGVPVLGSSPPALRDAELHGGPVEPRLKPICWSSWVRSCPCEWARPLLRGASTHDVSKLANNIVTDNLTS